MEYKDLTVLVADDFLPMRQIIKGILRKLGFINILDVSNGAEAWGCICSNRIDLIISDLNMPEVSGLVLLKRVRGQERTMHIPFLMITAEAYERPVVEAIEAKVSSYIVKPFGADTLMRKIEQLLPQH